jgi:hypothetical protein
MKLRKLNKGPGVFYGPDDIGPTQQLFLDNLKRGIYGSAAEAAQAMNLSRTRVSSMTTQLIARGFITTAEVKACYEVKRTLPTGEVLTAKRYGWQQKNLAEQERDVFFEKHHHDRNE